MFAYCGNNPVNNVDPTGTDWWHWAVAAVAVVALVAASILTCGGAAAAAATATAIATGTCAVGVSTAAVVTTGAAMGGAIAFAGSAISAAATSDSLDEFAAQGETALVNTAIGTGVGTLSGTVNSVAYCFIEGTPVCTESGAIPIEKIKAGDLVWAWDEESGDVALKPVVETYINETTELTHIFVNGEKIVSTPTHPFYCPVKGWTDAAHLRAGDILVLVNGEYVVVEKVQHELLESPVKVYNFQVADYHTYYVASGVLVHNKCTPQNYSPEGAGRDGAFNQAKRDYGIPTSQQPNNVLPNIDRHGNIVPGRVYDFGNGRLIRDDVLGHTFSDGGYLPRHFNGIDGRHYFY